MRIIKPSVEIIEQGAGLDGLYAQIEKAGRSCYASSHRIGEGTAKPFVDNMVKSGHGAMLEHGAVYLQMPYSKTAYEAFDKNPYSKVSAIEEAGSMFVSTNYRVIIENKLEDLLKYLVEQGPMHERRVTVRFQCQIAISREFNRHRVDSIAEQSTRYCNYSADKFGNEIKVVKPSWIDDEELDRIGKFKRVTRKKDASATEIWITSMLNAEEDYMELLNRGWKPQQARIVLPLDTATDLVHTAFVSDWKHFFFLRCDKVHAHPDAYLLASDLQRQFLERNYITE